MVWRKPQILLSPVDASLAILLPFVFLLQYSVPALMEAQATP